MKPPPRSVRPCRLFFPALAAALLLSLATGASLAIGPPAGSAPAATDNAAVPVAPAADNGWVDRTHARVERDLFETVVWFDRFFGDERMDVTERPESFLRWMNALRWDEEEHFSFRSTVRASLRLPRLRKRWRLVFSGETRGDPNAVTPEDPGNPGLDIAGSGPVPRSWSTTSFGPRAPPSTWGPGFG